MVTVEEAFAAALQHHSAGQLADAEILYRKILDVQPSHADSLHNLGILADQAGRRDIAVDLLGRLLASHPRHAHGHKNLGIMLWQQGRLDEAWTSLATALSIDPALAHAHLGLGLVERDRGHFDAAAASFASVLEYDPQATEALINLGCLRLMKGALDEAVGCFQRTLALGVANPMVFNNLGAALQKLGRFDEAEWTYAKAVAAQPDYVPGLTNLAAMLQINGKSDEALATAQRAVALAPDDPEANFNVGFIMEQRDRFEPALAAYRRSVACDPTFAQGFCGIGHLLSAVGHFADAVAAYQQALRVHPDYADALAGLAFVHDQEDRPEEAIRHHEAALTLDPNHAAAHVGLSLVLLRMGRFREGFERYEWRKKRADARLSQIVRDHPQPEWNGEDLGGRTLLLHWEQGFGDVIHFARYAPLIKGGEVMVEVPAQLIGLLRTMPGCPLLVPAGEPLPPFHCHCSLMSLPRLFWTTLDDVPVPSGYLHAEPDLVATWARRLGDDGSLRVGIAWQGSLRRADLGRSFPLAYFEPLAALDGVRLISLQKGDGVEQLEQVPDHVRVETLGQDYGTGTFSDTAAIMESLDLIITCDTAVAHLAGALGRPVWIAIKQPPDWRWGLERADSPWYRSARLFRQPRPGDWATVFDALRNELAELVQSRRSRAIG